MDWYSPGAIKWTEPQTVWVMEHYDQLRNGSWPAQVGSYVDPAISKPTPSSHAPFEAAIQTSADLTRRTEDCGHDGAMLMMHYAHGHSIDSLARYFRLSDDAVTFRLKVVLHYISRYNYRERRYRRDNAVRFLKEKGQVTRPAPHST